ncbi:hypothetical protein H8J86_16210 [Clostridium perfringens]|uniref:hypothetical protein n=1 Tax=Clostridium perfringens TaxID=1502 RepID=UPI0018E42723|nr:hypothetical protein [Clostridium perfringens]MBI6007474.1 hypothetical protein [Clostridium perfringens]MDM0534864.1 hypothetical protein [Clostridium perfringens]MDM0636881.1 hypothetical protein [Clostridium perfringens]
MKKFVLITKGILANKFKIEDTNNGEIYVGSKNIIARFFILFLRPWFNPVNIKLEGLNGKDNLLIKYSGKNNNDIFINNIKIGELIGRKRFATRYRFTIVIDNKSYFFEGDIINPIVKMYCNNYEIGLVQIKNQDFPHFDWEIVTNYDVDDKVLVIALLYNYYIWGRV